MPPLGKRGGGVKILHVINSLGVGGAEKLVADLAVAQKNCGHAVDVLCLKGGETTFRDNLEAAGIRVFDFGAGNNVYSPLNIFRIIPFLKRCDVAHVHLFPAQYWAAAAKFISRAKTCLVTTEHNTTNRRRKIACARSIDRLVYGRYSAIVGCSAKAMENLVVLLGGGERCSAVNNGVDLKIYESARAFPREKMLPASCCFAMIYVARLVFPKDQDCMIRALKKMPESVHAVFVGDGERRAQCESLAAELGVRDRAHFLGVRADVPALLKAADCVVMSSRYEGLSLSSVEGMAAGKPVVASDVPGLAEVVGGAGILFPQGDESALAGTIMRLATDKDFYAHTATACSRRAQNFDIRKTAAEYLKIYDEVCADFAERKEIKP